MLTKNEKYTLAKKAQTLRNTIRQAQAELDKINEQLISYVQKTGDSDFTWKDVYGAYVAPGADSTMLDGAKVKSLYPDIWQECQKVKRGSKAFFKW